MIKFKTAIIFTLVFSSFILMRPDNAIAYRPMLHKKTCVANMKTIEGAMELYIMENPHVAEGTFEIEILVNKGYLKSKPECMKANAINSKYTITIAKNNYSPGVITSDVSCQVHGDLSKQEGEHKYKESDPPPPLMFRINNVIRERSEYIIAGIFILIFWVGWILGRGILSGQ